MKINGKRHGRNADPGSYLTLNRAWKAGDRVEMQMPMRLTVEAMPDDPKTQAFLYGPLVLAGDLGTEGLTDQLTVGPSGPRPERIPLEIPTFQASAANPASWIKPAAAPLTFRTTGQQKDVTLAPLNTIFDKRYSVYWQVS